MPIRDERKAGAWASTRKNPSSVIGQLASCDELFARVSHAGMEFVVNEPESDPGIYVEQIDHGKLARISSTSLLLSVGALEPALRAGSPVTGGPSRS